MKVINFTLSGSTAFFKKPEVNTYYYFTYGNIHKVALLGMFGAILGYKGYSEYSKMMIKVKKSKELKYGFPEFYEKLERLKLSIIPNCDKGFISKKVQTFNNSVGYASKEQGGNLIIKEQWLENPSWDICFIVDTEEAKKLAEYLINRKCVYIPYLGKNDHYANITNVMEHEIYLANGELITIDCLIKKSSVKDYVMDAEDMLELDDFDAFKYEEKLPYSLNSITNNYELESFIYTNVPMKIIDSQVYKMNNKNLLFY